MRQTRTGFTIIELLIILAVIGILAGIGIVVWSGAITSSRDRARENDVKTWQTTFDLYKSRFGAYPVMPTADNSGIEYCLGLFTNYGGKCGQYNQSAPPKSFTPLQSIIDNVKMVGNYTPTNTGTDINKTFVGPIVYMVQTPNGSNEQIDVYFINLFEKSCATSDGFRDAVADNIYPSIAALVAGSSVNACYTHETFTYTPG